MRKNAIVKYAFTVFCCLIGLALSSCKKSHVTDGSTEVPANGTRTQMTLDSLFLYAKQVYFWNDALPDYATFQPRKYAGRSSDIDNYEDELYAITQLKINPATGKPYEYYGDGFPKYSYIQDLTMANPNASSNLNLADVDLEGNGNDIGIRPVYYVDSYAPSSPYSLFVTAVYPNSPALNAGVKRGWVIEKINGMAIGANYGAEHSAVEAALEAGSVHIEGVNYIDRVPFDLTLEKRSYKSSPVYTSKVFTKSGKKIGYLAFARFSVLTNPNADNPSDLNLDSVFTDFNLQNVTDLIIDLRYNGGGYVNTAEYLADLIAPSSLAGKKMYTEIYNSTMQAGKATILSNQPLLDSEGKIQYQNGKRITYADLDYSTTAASNTASFAKKGSLDNINNVVFIVSQNTASASELLINSLKPYMNVKLVGNTTYGKPVGFFPITLQNRYEVYMPLFETRNANNEGGYYSGMAPTVLSENDSSIYPFGDEREEYLSLALNLLVPGVRVNQSAVTMSIGNRGAKVPVSSVQLKPVNPNSEFRGMIETRHTIKK